MTAGDGDFSTVGDRYGEQLARGLRLTGEDAEYFARHRIERVAAVARERGTHVGAVLDFGCGTGGSLALLRAAFPGARVVGVEPAAGLREIAAQTAHMCGAEVVAHASDAGAVDLVYCNGVFHHIAPHQRAAELRAIATTLRGNALVCVWENSPFNPGTRLVMSRIPFDRGAHLLTPGALRRHYESVGVRPLRTEYHFVFPRALRALRVFEPALRGVPLGGQYVVIGERA